MARKMSVLEAGCILLVSTILFVAAALLVPLYAPQYLSDGGTWHAVTALMEIGCFLIPGALYLLIRRIPPASLYLRRCTAGQVALAIMMAFFGYMVVSFLQTVWLTLIELMGGTPTESTFPPLDTPFRLLLGVLSVAGSAALAEEFMFRGVLLPPLLTKGKFTALLLTAILFMLMHGAVETLPYTFLYGLLLGWLTLRSGSIFPAMAFHFANNSIPVLILYITSNITLPPELMGSDAASLLDDPATLAATLLWSGFIALICAGGVAAAMWAFHKISPPRLQPAAVEQRRVRLWHYLPYAASGFIVLCLLLLEALQVFGVLSLG